MNQQERIKHYLQRFPALVEVKLNEGWGMSARFNHLIDWCGEYIGAQNTAWTCDVAYHATPGATLRFFFKTDRDAILFKLTHC